MDRSITVELDDRQTERLERAAKMLGRTPEETVSLLLDQALRERDFPLIEFRDTAVGREAFVRGTRLKVWMLTDYARSVGGDVARVAEDIGIAPAMVAEALAYASAYPSEIEAAIAENDRGIEELTRLVPNLSTVEIDAPSP